MRMLMPAALLPILLIAACSKPAPPAPPTGLKPSLYMANDGRSRLCVGAEGRTAALIAFARDSAVNCSAAGRVEGVGASAVLIPAGEGACRIPLRVSGETVTLGAPGPACAYYCAPGAAWGGLTYRHRSTATAPEPLMPVDGQC